MKRIFECVTKKDIGNEVIGVSVSMLARKEIEGMLRPYVFSQAVLRKGGWHGPDKKEIRMSKSENPKQYECRKYKIQNRFERLNFESNLFRYSTLEFRISMCVNNLASSTCRLIYPKADLLN
ncbi:MAG: hypothetical protein ACE5NG_08915 [bacterium]